MQARCLWPAASASKRAKIIAAAIHATMEEPMIELWRWVMVGCERIDVIAADDAGSNRDTAERLAAADRPAPSDARSRSRFADRGFR